MPHNLQPNTPPDDHHTRISKLETQLNELQPGELNVTHELFRHATKLDQLRDTTRDLADQLDDNRTELTALADNDLRHLKRKVTHLLTTTHQHESPDRRLTNLTAAVNELTQKVNAHQQALDEIRDALQVFAETSALAVDHLRIHTTPPETNENGE